MTNNRRDSNKYCSLDALHNESDVEQFLVLPLLRDLGYGPEYLETKSTIQQVNIGKGKQPRLYFPDYIGYARRGNETPVLVVDAKHPNEAAQEGVHDAQLYASVIRRRLAAPKPDLYCVGVNGYSLIVSHYDSDTPLHVLAFADLVDGNPNFEALKRDISREALGNKLIARAQTQGFEFIQVTPSDLPSIFETCHRKIWKAEKRSPASAFYEFAKVMFVKIDEDRKLHERLEAYKGPQVGAGHVPRNLIRFSLPWITEMEETTDNPINTILFAQLAQGVEEQIQRGEKKRIFEEGEGIRLAPSTIKEVVRLLEHLDLYTVDEDLNGRLFETFLTATMRGKALGQFFTPRSVVKFMVKLARLQATRTFTDNVLDGCCGTGGFLIEAMADMADALAKNRSLTASERHKLMRNLRTEALWGIDAGQDPPVARIARLNMLLHKDGGSRIYHADALDKQLRTEPGLPISTRLEIDELRKELIDRKRRFSVVLTNPPFSMTYEKKNAAELAVLRDYTLALDPNGQLRTSLKSSVMFLERYWDLLHDDGRLLTIMDDSILNTITAQDFRKYIMSHFIIKAVISLPKNTFVKAQGSVSTSVLYLRKKAGERESQAEIFMALCGNVGHSDSGKERPHLNELPGILRAFGVYEETGDLSTSPPASVFLVGDVVGDNPTLRLDAQYFNPRYFATMSRLDMLAKARGWNVVPLASLLKPGKDSLTGGATPLGASYPDEGPKFIRVQNVHPNVLLWNAEEDPCLDTRTHTTLLKRSQLREDDVVLTITGTYGVAAVVPNGFGEANINQHCVRIAVNEQVSPHYLSVFLNSGLCRPQVDRAVTGSSRLALDYTSIRELRVLLPPDLKTQRQIAHGVLERLGKATTLRQQAATIEGEIAKALDAP